jgi:hypothetical protein
MLFQETLVCLPGKNKKEQHRRRKHPVERNGKEEDIGAACEFNPTEIG